MTGLDYCLYPSFDYRKGLHCQTSYLCKNSVEHYYICFTDVVYCTCSAHKSFLREISFERAQQLQKEYLMRKALL